MQLNTDKLNLFFSKIRELTFLQRLFSWHSVRSLSYDAFEEYKAIERIFFHLESDFDTLERNYSNAGTRIEEFEKNSIAFEKSQLGKDNELNNLRKRIDELNEDISQKKSSLLKYENTEDERARNYEKKITELNQIKTSLETQTNRIIEEKVQEKEAEFQKRKKQWSEHQITVEQTIKMICQNHFIKYIDKVPFRGTPDNTISICDEYIIFDAKCPSNDDLINFPKYIRVQTETVKKYINQENVRKDIFLVVPSNCIHVIDQLTYNMADYTVYIISKEALEPIILSLKKIEDYEFAEQLSPEERDNICRVIGKFAHTTKRKIQIDQFFANEFLELLVRCKNDLPHEILQHVIEFEKAEKLNPPTDKKSKQILTTELQNKNVLINAEANIKGVAIPLTFDEVKNLQ